MSEHKVYLEPSDVDALEAQTTYLRDRLLIRLLFRIGARISEVLAITVADIDVKQSTVTIEHLKLRITRSCPDCATRLSRTASFCPGCGSKVDQARAEEKEHRRLRTLPLDESTVEMVEEYINRGGPVTKHGKRVLFGITRNRAWAIVRDCADRAGLPRLVNPETGKVHNVSPHKLRDAFAVHALQVDDSGVGQRMLQEALGHRSFDTTARYRKVSGRELKEWHGKLWQKKEDG